MRTLHVAALTLLCMAGALSIACAHAQEPPPPPQPPGKDSQERRDRIERLESAIRDLEGALKTRDLSGEEREGIERKLAGLKRELKEQHGGGKDDPKGAVHEKMRRLENQIHELETALKNKDMGPEDRKELTSQLARARAHMEELRGQMKQDPHNKGARQFGGPGAVDPESHKLHMAAQELEHGAHDIAAKLRKTPPEEKKAREELRGLLTKTVIELFDIREKARAREIELIRTRLEELTQMLEKRKANRDAIIEKRVKQLSGESDDLDW